MSGAFVRTKMLLGEDAMLRLGKSRVAVFGLGGVGGYVVEALVRSGVGALDLIDHDTISESNINRQILATYDTIGMLKADAARARAAAINPECEVRTYPLMFLPGTEGLPFLSWDHIVDAIDTVTGKLAIISEAQRGGIPVISCMGTGNKKDPSALRVGDIYGTAVCPLARVMRRECRARGMDPFKVVYSTEMPAGTETDEAAIPEPGRRSVPGTVATVPAAAGLLIASEVIRAITEDNAGTKQNT